MFPLCHHMLNCYVGKVWSIVWTCSQQVVLDRKPWRRSSKWMWARLMLLRVNTWVVWYWIDNCPYDSKQGRQMIGMCNVWCYVTSKLGFQMLIKKISQLFIRLYMAGSYTMFRIVQQSDFIWYCNNLDAVWTGNICSIVISFHFYFLNDMYIFLFLYSQCQLSFNFLLWCTVQYMSDPRENKCSFAPANGDPNKSIINNKSIGHFVYITAWNYK